MELNNDNRQQTTLPATYYLTNFVTFLSDVAQRYRALLTPAETGFYQTFMELPLTAQCLYVRLVSRKGPWFRRERLHYEEIGDLDAAVSELSRAEMLAANPAIALADLLNLYTQPELQRRFPSFPRQLRKPELIQRLCEEHPGAEQCSARWYELLVGEADILQPLQLEILERFRLLFFGNLEQDLSEFVLSDLGLVRYESYSLQGHAAAFAARHELEQLHQAILYRRQVEAAVTANELESATALAGAVPEVGFAPAQRVRSKALNNLARFHERSGNYEQALLLYRQSNRPPARERVARILHAQEDYAGARQQCDLILEEAWDEQEATCARRILIRCARHLGQPRIKAEPKPIKVEKLVVEAGSESNLPVEQAALLHLTATPDLSTSACYLSARYLSGRYVENWLFNALFGLLFWKAVFAPVPDAFYHPFQRGPRDLYDSEFKRKRQPLIDQALAALTDRKALLAAVERTWHLKFGIANPFVGWTESQEPLLAQALHAIPGAHLAAIFERMLADLRNHCSGFPDLILFTQEGGYELVEVKGPGDRLQDHQTRWLEFFAEQGIPARVVHVEFR